MTHFRLGCLMTLLAACSHGAMKPAEKPVAAAAKPAKPKATAKPKSTTSDALPSDQKPAAPRT